MNEDIVKTKMLITITDKDKYAKILKLYKRQKLHIHF